MTNTSKTTLSKSFPSFAAATAITVLGSLASVGAQAKNSTFAELRGYENCVAVLQNSQVRGLVIPRTYYISKAADANNYYVNATMWESGDRVAKRLSCVTSANGRELLSYNLLDGRFASNGDRAKNVVKVADR